MKFSIKKLAGIFDDVTADNNASLADTLDGIIEDGRLGNIKNNIPSIKAFLSKTGDKLKNPDLNIAEDGVIKTPRKGIWDTFIYLVDPTTRPEESITQLENRINNLKNALSKLSKDGNILCPSEQFIAKKRANYIKHPGFLFGLFKPTGLDALENRIYDMKAFIDAFSDHLSVQLDNNVKARNANASAVHTLLELGAAPLPRNYYEPSLLHKAVLAGNEKIASDLLEHYPNLINETMRLEMSYGELCYWFIHDIILFPVNWFRDTLTSSQGTTALHLSTALGNPDITTLLLEKGANPNIKDFGGKLPDFTRVDCLSSERLQAVNQR